MPRNPSGDYTLPFGPVLPDTVIMTTWANPTMDDLAFEMQNSLDREGRGGMNAPLQLDDGADFAPAITFRQQPNLGFYRPNDGIMALVFNSQDIMRWSVTGVTVPTLATGGDNQPVYADSNGNLTLTPPP